MNFYKKIWTVYPTEAIMWRTTSDHYDMIFINSLDLADWIRNVQKEGGVVVVRNPNVDDSKSARTQKSN